jgi:hypothetical protein
MENCKLYPIRVLLEAFKTSTIYLSWLMLIIGGPMVYFDNELSWAMKFVVTIIVFLAIWLIYFSFSWFFHWRSLQKSENRAAYLALSSNERGKQIGSWLEGW